MAGGQERELKRRIRSVQSTKKITRAMELIAATRVAKASEQASASRPYSTRITRVIMGMAAKAGGVEHPLLRRTEQVRRAGFVVITSDRGLCGAYNSSVLKAAEREIAARRAEGADYSLVLVGKKAQGYFKFRNYRIDESFTGISDRPTYEDARAVAAAVRSRFEAGEIDSVDLIFTHFESSGSQKVVVRRFLPLYGLDDPDVTGGAEAALGDGSGSLEYEPSAEGILDVLLPRYVDARVYAALLDSAASEHAARQRAMKAATDNADELIKNLSRVMNRARQDAITTEIMEIVGGAEAMRQSQTDPSDLLLDQVISTDLLPDAPVR